MNEQEFETIYNGLIRLLYRLLYKFRLQNDEDAQALARIALYKAIKTFDDSLNLKLSNYAYRCIYNCLCIYVRDRKCDIPKHKLVAYEGIRDYGDGEEYFEEGSTMNYQSFVESQMYIDDFKRELSDNELLIVEELIKGTAKGDIRRKLGISREWFRRLLNRVRCKYINYNSDNQF